MFHNDFRKRVLVVSLAVAAAACGAFGYSNRVLWQVPSPNGRLVAVCQEVPVFDGPSYDVRLERPDGSLLRRLYRIGDGDPCTEVVWSPDSRLLAVLSGQVARMRFLDVEWALEHPSIETAHWSWRQVDLSTESRWVSGRHLRFSGPRTIELQLCPGTRRGEPECPDGPLSHRFDLPTRIVTGH